MSAHSIGVTYQLYVKLQNDLENWSEFDGEAQRLLADVVFSCFTLFGPDVIKMASNKIPTLFSYYSELIRASNLEVQTASTGNANNSSPVEAKEASVPAVQSPIKSRLEGGEPLTSMLSFYEQVGLLANAGVSNAQDMSIADRLEELVVTHLPRLRESQEMPGIEVKALFSDFSSRLISVGCTLELAWFSEEAFLKLFKEVWANFFNQRLKAEISVDYFTHCFNGVCATVKTAGDEFLGAKAELVRARTVRETHQKALENAGFRQKREAEEKLVAAQIVEVNAR